MPWTIYRYILRELLRLLLISTAVLVVVIGVAGAIKPLSEGLLSPSGLIKFILYTIPTMLGFALPFAAAFAGTLVFCRMVADNEIQACRASGLSYQRVLFPVVALGLVLTLGLFYLSNWVVPWFYLEAERMVQKDVVHLVVKQVQNGKTVALRRDLILYADAAESVDDPARLPRIPDSPWQPERMIMLQGVAVGRLDKQDVIRSDFTAERADVLLFRVRGDTWFTVRLRNATLYDVGRDADGLRGTSSSTRDYTLPAERLENPFKDRTRFMSWPELRALGREPERFDQVRQARQRLAQVLASERVLDWAQQQLGQGRDLTLLGAGEGERYLLRAAAVTRQGEALELAASEQQPVRIEYHSGGLISREWEARSGTLRLDMQEQEPRVRLELRDARVVDARAAGRAAEWRAPVALPRMRLPVQVVRPLQEQATFDLMDQAYRGDPTPAVTAAARSLRANIARLGTRVITQLNERAASAVTCLLVLLLAAVLSLRHRGSLPLVVYLWTFVLALLAVILTHTGERVALSNPSARAAAGVAVTWSGNLLLLAALALNYWKVSRN